MKEIESIRRQSKSRRVLLLGLGITMALGGVVGLLLPILPGLPLLIAGTVLLSRECPSFHRVLEKYQVRFSDVRRHLASWLKPHEAWGTRFPRPASDSSMVPAIASNSVSQEKSRAAPEVRSARKRNSSCAKAVAAGSEILIFDHNLEDLPWHAAPFEARGFEVYKCTSIESALRCIEREELDFALVDQGSAAFEGLRVIRHLVRYNPHAPFVVLTREPDVQCYQQAFSQGAVDYLEKPVPLAEINWMIDRFLSLPATEEGR